MMMQARILSVDDDMRPVVEYLLSQHVDSVAKVRPRWHLCYTCGNFILQLSLPS